MQEFNQLTSEIFQNPIFQQSLHKAQERFLCQPFALQFILLKQLSDFFSILPLLLLLSSFLAHSSTLLLVKHV